MGVGVVSKSGSADGRPTLKHVAELAGVSTATVSLVLNGSGAITPRTSERVLAAAKELGYQGNKAARALRTGSSKTIVVIVPEIRNPFFGEVIEGIEVAAQARGVDILLCNANSDARREKQYVTRFARSDVEGIIYLPMSISTAADSEVRAATESGPPIIVVDEPVVGIGTAVVCVDNENGARMVARHLFEIGCKRPAMVNGPVEMPTSIIRAEAFTAEAQALGIPVDGRSVFAPVRSVEGLAQAIRLLSEDSSIDAVFAGDDLLAALLMRELTALGRGVPDDVAVCGFDNIAWADLLKPALTTIAQPKFELGSRACELLLDNHTSPDRQLDKLPVSLIVRESTNGFRRPNHLTLQA